MVWSKNESRMGCRRVIDRKKVIQGLEHCMIMCEGVSHNPCKGCLYQGRYDCADTLKADALALLKEQEAVKPKKVKGYNPPIYTLFEYECEKCKSSMITKQPFCMGCGRPVQWE